MISWLLYKTERLHLFRSMLSFEPLPQFMHIA